MKSSIRYLAKTIVLAAIILGVSIYFHAITIQSKEQYSMIIKGSNIFKINSKTGQVYGLEISTMGLKNGWLEMPNKTVSIPLTLEDIERKHGLIPEE